MHTGWRDGVVVLSTGCSSRGSRFGSPKASSQLSVTVLPGDLMPTSGLHGHYMYFINKHTCRQNTHIHEIIRINFFFHKKRVRGVASGSEGRGLTVHVSQLRGRGLTGRASQLSMTNKILRTLHFKSLGFF